MKDPLDANLQLLADNIDSIEIADDPEEADILVCSLVTKPLMLPDNLVAHCSKCFRLVQHRPHVPRMPQKLCSDCATKAITKDVEAKLFITQQSLDEIVSEIRKKVRN